MITETITKWGVLSKTHGVKGQLVVDLDETLVNDTHDLELVFLIRDGLPVPFFLDSALCKLRNHRQALLAFDTVTSLEEAAKLTGTEVFISESAIHTENMQLSGNILIGYTVVDQDNNSVGIITEFIEHPGNDLLSVDSPSKKEILIPFVEQWILNFDENKKELQLQLPDGLLDI